MAKKPIKPDPDDPAHQPGPDPERLKIEGDWEDAVGKALNKEKPEDGWPNDEGTGHSKKE